MVTSRQLGSCLIMPNVSKTRQPLHAMCMIQSTIKLQQLSFVTCNQKTKEVQCVIGHKLNKVMSKRSVPNLNFKGLMVDNSQANWNAVQIVYNSGHLNEPMVDRDHICYFYQIQSMDIHTKQQIKLYRCEQHTTLCQTITINLPCWKKLMHVMLLSYAGGIPLEYQMQLSFKS